MQTLKKYEKKELNTLFDDCIKKHKIVYIGAHTGWGKTTSVKFWLDTKKCNYLYVSLNEDDFLDSILNCKKSTKIIVIDDINADLSDKEIDSIFNYIAKSNQSFVLIGRAKTVNWLKAFELTGQLVNINEKQLGFTEKDVENFFEINGLKIEDYVAKRIADDTSGWEIGVVSIFNKMKAGAEFKKELFEEARYEMYNYFDFALFNYWKPEVKKLLMQMSNFQCFSEKLASMITGKSDVVVLLNYILQIGSFLTFKAPDTYSIHPYFNEYLQKKQNELLPPNSVVKIFENAGLYYELEKDIASAMEYYYKAGNIEKVAELLEQNSKLEPGNAQYYETKKFYDLLTDDYIKNSPVLMCAMSVMNSIYCNIEKSEYWFDELKKFKKCTNRKTEEHKIATEKIALLEIALPHRGIKNIAKFLKNAAILTLAGELNLSKMSITGNMPSLMGGGKDFSEWAKNDKKIAKILGPAIEATLGKYCAGIINIALGESNFEKNYDSNFTEALTYLNQGLSEAEARGTIQMEFAALGVMAKLFVANGNIDTSVEIMQTFYEKAKNANCKSLIPNIEAFLTRQQIYCGNSCDIDYWLKNKSPNDYDDFFTFDRYRYITKVRCYIYFEKYLEASSLLEKLKYYYKNYDRNLGLIEAETLCAIVFYRQGNDSWQTSLNNVLVLSEKLGIIRTVSAEGMALVPLLNKIDYKCSKEFFEKILLATKHQAKEYTNYLSVKSKNDLSNAEKDVASLLVKGLKNDEIANLLSVSLNTVKYHLKNIYQKLNVNNKAQAIRYITENKII